MKTSIIIPVRNQLALTRLCVDSIRKYTRPGSYELIIVDNGSTDGTAEWLERQPDVRAIRLADNAGFPAACNRGLAEARGDNLLLLNNDTVVTPRWLDNLSDALLSDGRVGAVGPVTNAASYQTAISVVYRNLEEMWRFAEAHNRPDPAKREERVKLVGFCLLIKREAFEKTGFLDERFTPGNYEDDDYSMRLRLAGYRLLLCRDTFIHHFGSTSFRSVGRGAFAELLARNAEKFAAKWGFSSAEACALHEDLIVMAGTSREGPVRILDASCGCGATLLALLRRFPKAELYGLERNGRAARVAAAVFAGRAQVRALDPEAENPGFPRAFFDLVLLGSGWETMRRPREALRNLAASLKPDGVFVTRFQNPPPLPSHFQPAGRKLAIRRVAGRRCRRWAGRTAPVPDAAGNLGDVPGSGPGACPDHSASVARVGGGGTVPARAVPTGRRTFPRGASGGTDPSDQGTALGQVPRRLPCGPGFRHRARFR